MVYGKHQGIVYRVLPAFVTNQNQKMAERFNASVLKTDVASIAPQQERSGCLCQESYSGVLKLF